jgi:integrase
VPSGACVVEYHGARGLVFRAKVRDANGRQVQQTLGRAADGWTRTRAERELGKRLDLVERERWAKPTGQTFAAFVAEWRTTYLPSRGLKPSTLSDYKNMIDRHALPFFESMPLDAIRPEHLDAYVSAKTEQGLSPKTITNHLATLHEVWKVAKRWQRVRSNPLEEVDRPRLDEPETVILDEDEVAPLLEAFKLLAFSATPEEAAWWDTARRMVVVALGTALRRGELVALKWGDVEMLQRRLHVRRSLWRGQEMTPKSKASRRTVDFGLKTAAAFDEQWRASRYTGDNDRVFGHRELGTAIDPGKLGRCYLKPALTKAGVTKPGAWHMLRHTALTMDAAVGNPNAYVQSKAGHSSFSITERYIHAAQTAFPGAVERSEKRLFASTLDEEA